MDPISQKSAFSKTLKAVMPAHVLKGQCHEIFASGSFHELVSPQPQSIPLRPFQNFPKIRGDIRSSRFGKMEKIFNLKNFIILFGHLWVRTIN
jgi:hypothetical protein